MNFASKTKMSQNNSANAKKNRLDDNERKKKVHNVYNKVDASFYMNRNTENETLTYKRCGGHTVNKRYNTYSLRFDAKPYL